jgi:hypothetical protein
LHFPQIGVWSGGADFRRFFAPHCGQRVIGFSIFKISSGTGIFLFPK